MNVKAISPQIKLVEDFKHLYQTLSAKNVHNGMIQQVYGEDITFIDSFHHIEGREDFLKYCESIYENVLYSQFTFHEEMINDHQAMLTWTMNYAHPRLNSGNNIEVKGSSHIRFNDKVYFHQDYVDGGELLYEHIPVLSWILKKLKDRMV